MAADHASRRAPQPRRIRRRSSRRQQLAALAAERDALAAALLTQQTWRRRLVEAMPLPALLVAGHTHLVAANTAASTLLGLRDGAVGATVVQALGNVPLIDAIREVDGDRQGTAGRYGQRRQPADEDRPAGASLQLEIEHAGRQLDVQVTAVDDHTLVVLIDRTRERHVEALRRDFVVNASHELKTPVTSIQTLTEALAVTVATDQQRAVALVDRLSDAAEHLAQLVNDLLDLRRLEESGPLERTAVDVVDVVRRVVGDLRTVAEDVDIDVTINATGPAVVAAVAADVEAIVKNLVENAIRYNRPAGSVTIAVQRTDGFQQLTVTDTGIGIPAQDHARVFERFYRVDVARSRAAGGTGLGLSIVRNAVQRLGGTVSLQSTPGVSTTFTVQLPIESVH